MSVFEPGTLFANHRIGRLLGEGRVAEVYEAIAPGGAWRALKVLKRDAPLDDKSHGRLVQEAEAIAGINHVNVVRFFGAGVTLERVWLLLELVRGADLKQRM